MGSLAFNKTKSKLLSTNEFLTSSKTFFEYVQSSSGKPTISPVATSNPILRL